MTVDERHAKHDATVEYGACLQIAVVEMNIVIVAAAGDDNLLRVLRHVSRELNVMHESRRATRQLSVPRNSFKARTMLTLWEQ